MNEKINQELANQSITFYNMIFGWVKIKIDGIEYPINYTIGSLLDLEEYSQELDGTLNLEEVMSSPQLIAKFVYYGLPLEAQDKITERQLAYQINISDLMKHYTSALETINKQLEKKGDEISSSKTNQKTHAV
jgi:hypothetical protein